jgi:VWFA-related protein
MLGQKGKWRAHCVLVVVALVLGARWGTCPALGQTGTAPEVTSQETQPAFTLQVQRNLVLVRVVVRDAKGHPVTGLRKEDFRLLDSRKPQVITHFSKETTTARPAAPEAVAEHPGGPPTQPEESPAPSTAQRFLGLYFDDMLMAFQDVVRTRDAASRYLAKALQPGDRVGIFTSSAQNEVDFTDDRGKIQEALSRLRPRPRTPRELNPCPNILDYQAYKIVHQHDPDAIEIAAEDILNCRYHGDPALGSQAGSDVDFEAMQILNFSETESEDALRRLEELVRHLAVFPGQRSIVLISSGFLTVTLKNRWGDIVDRALRANVIINTFDARGLFTVTPGGDASSASRFISRRPDLMGRMALLKLDELRHAAEVLSDTAVDTGGTYFHNSNDFDEGFRLVGSLPEVYYVLGFSPQNLKLDGRFHPLQVSLATPKGLSVQARRGYFAPRSAGDPAAKEKEEIEQAVFSQDELHELPVQVNTQFFKINENNAKLSILTRVDLHLVRFRKEQGRNLNNLTFVTALFDRDGKYMSSKEKTIEFHLRDESLEKLTQSGITAKTSFDLRPGTYLVRQVVRDAEGGQLSGLNRTVEIPY